jgi:sirohydrochlorin cobaltochelatase
MPSAIVLAAFGTSTTATATYQRLAESLRPIFPGREIVTAVSAPRIVASRQGQTPGPPLLATVLAELAARGVGEAVLQSLHLFPGREFHALHLLARQAPLPCRVGLPLLTSPADHQELAELWRPAVAACRQEAILVLGHGTDHPSWTAYYALEKILRQHFGRRVFVAVVEKFPETGAVAAEIAARHRSVAILPLFLVAGRHLQRDILADTPNSWCSRLRQHRLTVEVIGQGLGLTEGIERLIARHIRAALAAEPTATPTHDTPVLPEGTAAPQPC